ncbi:MCE family protein [Solihabitans fulvus]|uniref:MCE family protein n=1 Tax=Solihabitans fulvus TaxID=1892852 RepID=A0A5B2WID1_9PSEU|nr:MCE family protein [Solihabitans fulvus]KAA2250176.1 MCE family protein [Solihabitans fulvus]
MLTNHRLLRLERAIAIACVLVLLASAAFWQLTGIPDARRITAYFGQAVGLYVGSDVRVLGVRVGVVELVHPEGDVVRVVFSVSRDVPVPAGAQAAVIAPALVSDRYVQLAPAYTEGPQIADDAVIPRERTATPVELDELYDSLNKISTALGPNGANRTGALSDLITTGADNLAGNGKSLHDTITQFGAAAATLTGSQQDLFGTVDNLAKFSSTLASSDGQLRDLVHRLADVSGFLAGERGTLADAADRLATALEKVAHFINDNRASLKSSVDNLASLTKVLVDEKTALGEVLRVVPLTLNNVTNAYDTTTGSLNVRLANGFVPRYGPQGPLLAAVCRQAGPSGADAQALAELCGQPGGAQGDPATAPPLPLTRDGGAR